MAHVCLSAVLPASLYPDEHSEDISCFHTSLTIQISSWVVQKGTGVSPHHRSALGVLGLRSILTSPEDGIRPPCLRAQCQKPSLEPMLPSCWLHLLPLVPSFGFSWLATASEVRKTMIPCVKGYNAAEDQGWKEWGGVPRPLLPPSRNLSTQTCGVLWTFHFVGMID